MPVVFQVSIWSRYTNRFFFWLIHFIYLIFYQTYFARIEEVNLKGPALRAVLEMNPSALIQAAALDKERRLFGRRSYLHGIPVLLKVCFCFTIDLPLINGFFRIILRQLLLKVGIHTGRHSFSSLIFFSGLNTTAGSFSLLGSVVPEDAWVVKRLRAAGAIILGKPQISCHGSSCGIRYLTITMQGRLIYPNSPVLEENFPLDGQEEVANVRTPIMSTACPVVLLLDLE